MDRLLQHPAASLHPGRPDARRGIWGSLDEETGGLTTTRTNPVQQHVITSIFIEAANAQGLTMKQVVAYALKAGGVSVADANLKNRTLRMN
jgi:hypothetical protein